MSDSPSGSTADLPPRPSSNPAIESPKNGSETILPTIHLDILPRGELDTKLSSSASGHENLHEDARQSLQADTLASPLTTEHTVASPGPNVPHCVHNQAAQLAPPGDTNNQPGPGQNKRVAQLKSDPKKVKRNRPRRSAYGLRSGRKEV